MAEQSPSGSVHKIANKDLGVSLPNVNQSKALRAACDYCHQAKVRCTGGGVGCGRCQRDNVPCHYSYPARVGKPKGSRNRKTIEKLNALAQKAGVESSQADPPHQSFSDVRPQSVTSNERFEQCADEVQDHNSPIISNSPQCHVMDASMDDLELDIFTDFPGIIMGGTLGSQLQQEGQQEEIDSTLTCHFSSSEGLPAFQSLFPGDDIDFDNMGLSPSIDVAGLPTPHTYDTPASKSPPGRLENIRSPRWNSCTAEVEGIYDSLEPQDCDCLHRQTNHLCQLHTLEKRLDKLRLDNVMRLSGTIFQTLEKSYRCNSCINDAQVLQIGGMIFRVLLRWIGTMCRGSENISIQLGDYSLTGEDSAWMNTSILSRLLSKCKANAELFRRRIALTFSSPESQNLDHKYLENVVNGLVNALDLYIIQLDNRKADAEMAGGRIGHHNSAIDRFF